VPTYADLLPESLAGQTWLHAPAPFACLRVHGPDAASFLHRLCTQDVEGLRDGDARPAAFLTAKGKVEALVWIARLGEELWIETQAQAAASLAALLDRYHFSEKLAIETPANWTCRQVVGAHAHARTGQAASSAHRDGGVVRFAGAASGLQWVRTHGASLPPASEDLPLLDEPTWQCLRVAAGLPWTGIDADTTTLALEAGIDDHVSLTKGCYTGQEIVARIHTYGHTNRRLCRLRWRGSAPSGAQLTDPSGEPVGRVTSIAPVPGTDFVLALGYLPHELANPGTQLVLTPGGTAVEVCG